MMKIISITYVVLASASLMFLSCKKHTDPPATSASTASVMFVNGCTGPSSMNVSVNGANLGGASDLAFLTNSGYQAFTPGTIVSLGVSVFSVPDTSSSNDSTSFPPGMYSFFVGGSLTNTIFVESIDDLSAPASGMAKVRFVNLSVDSLNLNCYIGSQKIDSNVSFGTISQFFLVDAATNEAVLLQDPSRLIDSAMLSGQSFIAGKIYTIMFTGTQSGTLTNKPMLTVIYN